MATATPTTPTMATKKPRASHSNPRHPTLPPFNSPSYPPSSLPTLLSTLLPASFHLPSSLLVKGKSLTHRPAKELVPPNRNSIQTRAPTHQKSTRNHTADSPADNSVSKENKPIIGGHKTHNLNNTIVLFPWHWVAKKITAEEDNRSINSSISYSHKFSVKLNKSVELNNLPIFCVNPLEQLFFCFIFSWFVGFLVCVGL